MNGVTTVCDKILYLISLKSNLISFHTLDVILVFSTKIQLILSETDNIQVYSSFLSSQLTNVMKYGNHYTISFL